jgi:glyoxylase-like metal-dependent hydrolase (beta-lactamase superfamily II)
VRSIPVEVTSGVWRVTFPLPLGIDHVHCYLLRADDGTLTAVDTGLGVDGAHDRWREALRSFREPVERIVITHFHPDHVGAAADLAELTGAPVYQGRIDYAQCSRAWSRGAAVRMSAYLREHGMPAHEVDDGGGAIEWLRRLVHFAPEPIPLEPGDRIAGWEVLHLPGHADGHLALLRDGVLVAGDTLLAAISPNVGLYPDGRPDPLGDYLESLARIESLGPTLALTGHREPVEDPPRRARELVAHHRERLERTARALDGGRRSAYQVSLALFPEPLAPGLRRFALAETRAHLERLAFEGRVRRLVGAGGPAYAAA